VNIPFHISSALFQRKELGINRSLSPLSEGIDFWSNDYLGLAKHPQTKANLLTQIQGSQSIGSTGSRLISGNSTAIEQIEQYIAQQHQVEAALLFNSGYDANLGLFSSIAGEKDAFICDELLHASIIDGVRLSKRDKYIFKHNRLDNLESLLKEHQEHYESIYVVVESLYSMDGDFAPLQQIADLCSTYRAFLIVDEAHSTGLYGKYCTGLVEYFNLQSKVFASIHTYGKAFGLHGAVVCGRQILKEYLINFARSFVFSTAAPHFMAGAIQAQYQFIQQNPELRASVLSMIETYNSYVKDFKGIASNNVSAIQYIQLGDSKRLSNCAKELQNEGIMCKAILYPTVPLHKERIRITLHAHNTKDELAQLFNILEKYA
jgi:8-amino-7-oxononanoate synthase